MPARLAWLPAAATALAICATPQKTGFQLGLPGSRTPMTVERVTPRGPYLEVALRAPGLELVSYAPDDEACRGVLAREHAVDYATDGGGGSFSREGRRCEAAGIGSLDAWRERRARPRTRSPVPSAQASFRVLHRDEQVVLVRGRFPLAGLLGWVGGDDTVAAIPNAPECARPLESGVATLQYFPAGRDVLTLTGEGGLCPVLGLLRPPPR